MVAVITGTDRTVITKVPTCTILKIFNGTCFSGEKQFDYFCDSRD